MTAVSPLVFPGSRVLMTWWRQLAPLQPRALWVGHLVLHRVEALAALARSAPLDPLATFVLKAVCLQPEPTTAQVGQRLRLNHSLLQQILLRLDREDLVQCRPDGTWRLTNRGEQGLTEGIYPKTSQERREFFFVDPERPGRPPHFLGLKNHPAMIAWQATDNWNFDPSILHESLRQSLEWKQRHGFPVEIQQVVTPGNHQGSDPIAAERWQQIIVDRPQHLVAALLLAPAATGERLLGYAVQHESWSLQIGEPTLTIDSGWQETFAELADEPSPEQWSQAWRAWCQPRALPTSDVDACQPERRGCRLRITTPPRLVEQLRAA